MLAHKREDCLLSKLPKWLIPSILEYVATRSKDNEWRRCGAKEDWFYSYEFMELIVRKNTDFLLSDDMLRAINEGVCTKNVTSVQFEPQPFLNCIDCGMHLREAGNLGVCMSCAVECHRKLGHTVVLNGVLSAFCDCAGSARCKITDRLLQIDRKEVENDESEYGILVCIQKFPQNYQGQKMLPATPGEFIKVKREDIRNGLSNGDLHGVSGSFPMNTQYVRWINEFVIAGADHEGKEEKEMSYEKGDFILVVDMLQGPAADGKMEPWEGTRCSPKGVESGWFEGHMVELVSRYEPEFMEKKIKSSERLRTFLKLKSEGELLEALEMGKDLCEEWLELMPPDAPAAFSGKHSYTNMCQDMMLLYRSLNEYKVATEYGQRYIKAVRDSVPARPAPEVLLALVETVECGCRDGQGEEMAVLLREFETLMPDDPPLGLQLMASTLRMAVSFVLGKHEESREHLSEFNILAQSIPSDSQIWFRSSYWWSMVSMHEAPPDIQEKIGLEHFSRVCSTSEHGYFGLHHVLEAFEVLMDGMLAGSVQSEQKQKQFDQCYGVATTLKVDHFVVTLKVLFNHVLSRPYS